MPANKKKKELTPYIVDWQSLIVNNKSINQQSIIINIVYKSTKSINQQSITTKFAIKDCKLDNLFF